MLGGLSFAPRTTARNGSSTASIMCEWKACEVWSGRQSTPLAPSSWMKRDTASVGPDTVHRAGAFATIDARRELRRRSCADKCTLAMAPGLLPASDARARPPQQGRLRRQYAGGCAATFADAVPSIAAGDAPTSTTRRARTPWRREKAASAASRSRDRRSGHEHHRPDVEAEMRLELRREVYGGTIDALGA